MLREPTAALPPLAGELHDQSEQDPARISISILRAPRAREELRIDQQSKTITGTAP